MFLFSSLLISRRIRDDDWVPQCNLFHRAEAGPRGRIDEGQTSAEKARIGVQQRPGVQSRLLCLRSDPHEDPSANSHIDWQGAGWFAHLGKKTLEANCGYEKWRNTYGNKKPLDVYGPGQHKDAPLEEWCLEVDLCPAVYSMIHLDAVFMFLL